MKSRCSRHESSLQAGVPRHRTEASNGNRLPASPFRSRLHTVDQMVEARLERCLQLRCNLVVRQLRELNDLIDRDASGTLVVVERRSGRLATNVALTLLVLDDALATEQGIATQKIFSAAPVENITPISILKHYHSKKRKMPETRKMAIAYENARSLKGCPFEKMLTEHKESAVYYWDNRLDKEFLEYYKKNVKEDVIKTPLNVTDIIYRMREYPSMRVILDKYNIDWKTNIKKKYGKIPTVISKKHPLKANLHGTFMDYVIRHRLSAELNIDFQDSRVEVIIKGVFPGNDEVDKSVIDEIEQSYSICKTNNRTYEILDHLLIISRAHSFYFGEIVRKQIYNKTILPKSIQEALEEYINSITFYSNIGLNPVVGNRNICIGGDADIINGTEIIDIKTSTKSDVDSLTWYQLLLYASLHWYNTGILIKTLTVFNPLYGTTRTITLETEENLFKDVLDWVVSKTNGEKLTYCPKDILDIKPIKVNRVIYNFDDEQCTAIKTDGKRCTFTSTKDTLCTRHYNKKNSLS